MRRVIEIDGTPIKDLDGFAAAVRNKQAGEATRLLTVDLQGRQRMVTLEADNHYWPLVEIIREDDGWVRRRVPSSTVDDTP